MQFAQANAQTKNCKRACFAHADKIVLKNFPSLKKNKNTLTHLTRQKKVTTINSITQWTEGQQVTAPKKNGGGSGYINSCAINKHGAFRQVCASNPPLLLAAKRYASP